MKIFSAPELRNVAIVGHNTVGKTTLVASLLHVGGATTRHGRIEDGTCPTDFDTEEIERKISINLACAHVVYRDVKINFLDAPGYGIFAPEARAAVAAADSVIIVCDAVSGVEVQTEKAWKFAREFERPVLFVINRMDRERASFERAMESLQKKFGREVVALQIPIGEEKGFHGTVDLVRMKAHITEEGKRSEEPIPAELADRAKGEHEKLVEMVAEGEDELMEKFFAQGTLEASEIVPGLKKEIAARKIYPVLCASSNLEVGAQRILEACAVTPPLAGGRHGRGDRQGREAGHGSSPTRRTTPSRRSSRRFRIRSPGGSPTCGYGPATSSPTAITGTPRRGSRSVSPASFSPRARTTSTSPRRRPATSSRSPS